MKTKKFYHCSVCKNLFGVINDSGVNPVCCGQPMEVLQPGTTDAAQEKHVPVIVRNGKSVTVKVGEVTHPMLAEHYIQWILLVQGNKFQRVVLSAQDAPEATFTVDCDTAPVTALEYCNLHGLWQAEA